MKRLLSDMSSEERKQYPVTSGFIDYFPDAIAMVSHVSFLGNEKHNPGQPLHWAREKSADHVDCLGRHLVTRDEVDSNGVVHMAEAVWRALAELQLMLEAEYKLDPPRGAK